MKQRLLQTLLVVALAAAAVGSWRFAVMVIHEYDHAHEVVLTLKLGVYPDSADVLEANRQGRMEAIAQLGAYTLCLAALVGSALALVRSIRKKERAGTPASALRSRLFCGPVDGRLPVDVSVETSLCFSAEIRGTFGQEDANRATSRWNPRRNVDYAFSPTCNSATLKGTPQPPMPQYPSGFFARYCWW